MNDRIKLNGKEYKIVFDFEAYIILEGLWGLKSMQGFGTKVLAMANKDFTFSDARALIYAGLNRAEVTREEIDKLLNSQKKPVHFLNESKIVKTFMD